MNGPCQASAERAVGDSGKGDLQFTTQVSDWTLYSIEVIEDLGTRSSTSSRDGD